MSGGPSFLDGLSGFDLQGLLDQLRQSPQGFDPSAAAPAPTLGGLNPFPSQPMPIRGAGDTTPSGHEVGSIDQRRPSIAMGEDQVQALERAQAGSQDLAALGGSPLDRLLYDRSGFGGGAGGFSGTADPYSPRDVPMPPSRPSDADLLSAPTATGSLSSPRRPTGSSNVAPAPGVTAADTGNPASSNLQPVNAFDPLTGQPVSGSPKMLQAPGMGGPTAGGGQMPTAGSDAQGGSFLERFARGIGSVNPQIGDLLFHLGIGIAGNRNVGAGISAGLQSFGSNQGNQTKQLLEQYKLQSEIQQRNAARAYVRSRGGSPELQALAEASPSSVLTGGLTGLNVQPPANYRLSDDGKSYQFIPGSEADPEMKAKLAAAGRDGSYTLSPGQTRFDEEGKPVTAIPSAPRELRPGATLYDTTTLKPIVSAPAAKPDGFDTETKLRGEFAKGLGTFADVHDGYGRLIAATKQRQENPGSVSPASDISLVFGYMKMLDPGSVVREGEYATAKNAAGVPDRVVNAYNKALNGEFLSDAQRKDFLGQASELYGTARKTAEGVADRYRNLATSYGVDPGRSVYLPEMPTPPKIGQQGQATGGAAARFQALMNSGLSKSDAFAQMRKEGL